MSRPTYEQLAELVARQTEEIALLKAHISWQDARIAELERQLAETSLSDGLDALTRFTSCDPWLLATT